MAGLTGGSREDTDYSTHAPLIVTPDLAVSRVFVTKFKLSHGKDRHPGIIFKRDQNNNIDRENLLILILITNGSTSIIHPTAEPEGGIQFITKFRGEENNNVPVNSLNHSLSPL